MVFFINSDYPLPWDDKFVIIIRGVSKPRRRGIDPLTDTNSRMTDWSAHNYLILIKE